MTSPVSTQHSGKIGRAPSDVGGVDTMRPALPPADAGLGNTQAPEQSLQNSETRERIVVGMMALVAMAVGGVAHVHFGYSIIGAAMTGLLAFAIFMALNGLLVRSAEISRLRTEVARLEHEMARCKVQGIGVQGIGSQGIGSQGIGSQGIGPSASAIRPAPEGRTPWTPPNAPEAGETRTSPRVEPRKMGQRQPAAQASVQASASTSVHANNPAAAPVAAQGVNPVQPGQRAFAPAHHSAAAVRPETLGASHAQAEAQSFPQSPMAPDARWEPSAFGRQTRMMPAQSGPAFGRNIADTKPDTKNDETARPARGGAPAARAGAQSAPACAGEADGSSAPAFQNHPAPEIVDVPGWSGTSEATDDALRDAWSFRPSDTARPPVFAAGSDEAAAAHTSQVSPARSEEADLELVQRKIKALADEVNATEALRNIAQMDLAQAHTGPRSGHRQASPYHGAAGIDDSVAALRTTAERMKQPRPSGEKSAGTYWGSRGYSSGVAEEGQSYGSDPRRSANRPIEQAPQAQYPSGSLPSLDALIPASAQPIAVSRGIERDDSAAAHDEKPGRHDQPALPDRAAPPAQARRVEQQHNEFEPLQPAQPPKARDARPSQEPRYTPIPDGKLSEIAAAIETSRMDVFLKPIVGLGDYGVAHFEVDVRLKNGDGVYIDDATQTLSVGASDLLALFDVERLNRTARVAEQLEARGKSGSLLSPTAGQSMTDGKYLEAFARTFEERTAISGQLVLTFTQADIAAFGPGTWQALADMNSFGFRFALAEVTHLATDFSALAERGFAFVKLPAEAFLEGMPAGHGMVPPADICRYMAGAGVTLVVDSIDDQAQLAKVFGFGALFGQGQLFGGARKITLESLAERRTAAA
ncbi:MAG TPA: EAL domain-containing protein [Hyphomicrobium sp.]|nr:EAL domain-containing protein [Hyphomicrobium sp.]